MRKWLSRQWTWLFAPCVALALALAACSTTDTGPSAPWSPSQNAYVALATYQAVQGAALDAAQTPGLSAKDVAEIQAGEATATAALTAALGQDGDMQAQVIDALVAAAPEAVRGVSAAISAAHGGDGPDTVALAVASTIGALGQAPEVALAIERVRAGWQPAPADLAEAIQSVRHLHQQIDGQMPRA